MLGIKSFSIKAKALLGPQVLSITGESGSKDVGDRSWAGEVEGQSRGRWKASGCERLAEEDVREGWGSQQSPCRFPLPSPMALLLRRLRLSDGFLLDKTIRLYAFLPGGLFGPELRFA